MQFELIGNLVGSVEQCDPDKLGRPWIVYLDITSVNNATKQVSAPQRVAANLAPSRARQLVRSDDVLVSTVRPNLNAVALVQNKFDGEIASTGFCVLRPKKTNLSPKYLFYFAQTAGFVSHLSKIATGASYPAVTDNDIFETPIPLPELSEQKRIAGQLGQADRLRRTRRYALELGDTILPAAFLEIFGDPVENPRGWKRARVRELGKVQTGNTPPREEAANYGRAIEWIKSDNISLDELYPTRAKEMLSDQGMDLGTVVAPGSILVTCIAGSATSIGNVCITDRSVAFNQQINAVTPHMGVLPLFLYGLFLAAKPFVQRNTTSAMKRMITKSKLEELLFVLPPETAQRQFSQVVSTHERLRAGQREALRQADHFFRSLLHQAFDVNG